MGRELFLSRRKEKRFALAEVCEQSGQEHNDRVWKYDRFNVARFVRHQHLAVALPNVPQSDP